MNAADGDEAGVDREVFAVRLDAGSLKIPDRADPFLESVPEGVGGCPRTVGTTHRMPRLCVGGLHPPYNRQTGLLGQTLRGRNPYARALSATPIGCWFRKSRSGRAPLLLFHEVSDLGDRVEVFHARLESLDGDRELLFEEDD